MVIKEVVSKNEWENFLNEAKPHSFLESWNWGEVQKKIGAQIFRLGLYEDGELQSVSLVLFVRARRGSFLFCPHGPVLRPGIDKKVVMAELLSALKNRGREMGCAFIRISPLFENSSEWQSVFSGLGFRSAPVHLMHPELAWLLNIEKDEEILMKEMRKTTRYLVRKAEKDGVVIREGEEAADLEAFLKVYRTTVDRQNFTPFKDEFFKRELEIFKADNQVKIFLAEYQKKVIGAAMIVFYGQSAFYHHGASDQAYSQIPGSYLLQWRVIQAAKARGLRFYNFWGIVRPSQKKHPWAGLSLFKTGFGGFEEEYLHVQDFPLSSRYWLVYVIEKIRRIRRGL